MNNQKSVLRPRYMYRLTVLIMLVSFLSPLESFSNGEEKSKIDSVNKIDSTVLILNSDDPYVKHIDILITQHFSERFGGLVSESTIPDTDHLPIKEVPHTSDSVIKARLKLLDNQTPFELTYNDRTKAFINLYAVKKRDLTSRFMGLSEHYFPMIEEQLDIYDMPIEMKYLAIVESALNATARSRAGAKGLWQFMYSTGKIYGLQVNSYIDERNDPIQSTEAACQYLKYLHGIYDDWNLALAAYNCGPGNVNKAIRRSGGKRGYWEIYPFLPRETRGYVPAFIAVNYIMAYGPEHEIYPVLPPSTHFENDTVMVNERISLTHLSKVLELELEHVQFLNPQYKLSVIPDLEEAQVLRLPKGKLADFIVNENAIYEHYNTLPEEEVAVVEQFEVYRVRSGDYLGKIANRYHVSVSSIKDWNNLRSNNLRVGQRLTIYHSSSSNRTTAKKTPQKKTLETVEHGNFIYYEIQSGDTLWDIAKAKGISTGQLKSLNQNLNEKRLRPGDKIVVGKS